MTQTRTKGMAPKMEYRIKLTRDDNKTWLVTFPDFPEAHTFGRTEAEARRRALDALETIIDAYIRHRRPIPEPTVAKRGDRTIAVPMMVALKISLYAAFRESHTTKSALAKKLNCHPPQVDRLFEVRHQSRLDQIEAAAAALGKKVEVRLADKSLEATA